MEKYKAVTVDELREILGNNCSPDPHRKGYVIGPDITGRLCHVASCSFMSEAVALAKRYNERKSTST